MESPPDYQQRLAQERRFYKDREEVHELPGIFHYWSEKYVLPKLRAIGFKGELEFILDPLQQQCERTPGKAASFISLGSGNCDLEIQIAARLRERGITEFHLECLDLNETMLERGRAAANERGVAGNLTFTPGDLNQWEPAAVYDAVVAKHALHHVVELEHVFRSIKSALAEPGVFVVADMIGRNGHRRSAEALPIVREFWRKLPPSHRYNHQLQRYEEHFEDWDCSREGFEGIRSQDILPLLMENFHFTHFVAFANLIDIFLDRSFGPNFDPSAEWDRIFIDDLQRRDEEELCAGKVAPTHLYAILSKQACPEMLFIEPFTPSFCVRSAFPDSADNGNPGDAYDWDSIPRNDRQELKVACAHLAAAERRIRTLDEELRTSTTWGRGLERKVLERTEWAQRSDKEVDDLTSRALQLEEERAEALAFAQQRDLDFQDRTKWALSLQEELQTVRRSQEQRVSMRRCIHDLLRGIIFHLRRAFPQRP